MIGPISALVFDVDGTLAETEEAHRLSFNAAFAEAGLDWSWSSELYTELLKVTGGKERIAHFRRGDADPALIRRLHERKTQLYASRVAAGEVALRPGIAALIAEARRREVPLAIATTTSLANIEALLAATLGPGAMAWFHPIVCGDMVAAKKPAPDVYQAVLAGLGTPAAGAVAIEDSANGVGSARAAGLAVIATPSLYSAADDFSDATVVLSDTSQIAGALGWVSRPEGRGGSG